MFSAFNPSKFAHTPRAVGIRLLPGRRNVGCLLIQVCVHLDGLNAENTFHSVYVTNKAHLSLICNLFVVRFLYIIYSLFLSNCDHVKCSFHRIKKIS